MNNRLRAILVHLRREILTLQMGEIINNHHKKAIVAESHQGITTNIQICVQDQDIDLIQLIMNARKDPLLIHVKHSNSFFSQ